ncbi:mediator of RNA polymerase II transcription subunit 1 [Thalassophryne amazonica]|uniref:mediator of RNA polymerase II transcription subunit 1 n=1 Tax=Thalassophryne amazonica TaxID=390379 RepID=UPI00147139AC|nr:mediator of RNA polymerase II transcription subunit 1 [Thalassophryne amazonica]
MDNPLFQSLLQLLRSKMFDEFSTTLEHLFSQYNIPGDNEMKLKLFASLRCLRQDLAQMFQMSRSTKQTDLRVDVINNSRMGFLTTGEEDCPWTLQFYTSSADIKKPSNSQMEDVQAGQVAVGLRDQLHKLQMTSVIPQPPQLDPTGWPMLLPVDEVPFEKLPACFLLRLQPVMPMTASFLNKLNQITDVSRSDVDLQWAPLPKLLMKSRHGHSEAFDLQDAVSFVPLPGELLHRYVFPGASWMVPVYRGTLVDTVFFTHPAHVPVILELLRHQSTINTLLKTCMTAHSDMLGNLQSYKFFFFLFCSVCDLQFEVLPESDTSFSVTFQRPETDSFIVLLVDVVDSHRFTCTVFGAGMKDTTMDEEIGCILKKSMSIPLTLRVLCIQLEQMSSDPLCPDRSTTTEAVNDLPTSRSISVTETNRALTTEETAFCQSGSDPECSFTGSGSGSDTQSELLPDINTNPPVNM